MKLRVFFSLLVASGFLTATVHGSEWLIDYEQALAKAKATKKYVLLDFTGSDWCGPCIQMNKAVFSKPAFLAYASQNLILVEIDFPKRKQLPENIKEQNARLAHQYQIEESGYPTVVLLNPEGRILGQLEGYGGERPADVIAWVERLRGK